MQNHLIPSPFYRDADEAAGAAHEPMIGYEAALPYLLSGHDGAHWGREQRQSDAPLSCSDGRRASMGAAGQDF